tara:strand:- start:5648 stop:5818 length:171 start_codon:yes stop_codon:yes gene_type:complete
MAAFFYLPWPRYFFQDRFMFLFIEANATLPEPIEVFLPLPGVADSYEFTNDVFLAI